MDENIKKIATNEQTKKSDKSEEKRKKEIEE